VIQSLDLMRNSRICEKCEEETAVGCVGVKKIKSSMAKSDSTNRNFEVGCVRYLEVLAFPEPGRLHRDCNGLGEFPMSNFFFLGNCYKDMAPFLYSCGLGGRS
jgi:hypothetical protein